LEGRPFPTEKDSERNGEDRSYCHSGGLPNGSDGIQASDNHQDAPDKNDYKKRNRCIRRTPSHCENQKTCGSI